MKYCRIKWKKVNVYLGKLKIAELLIKNGANFNHRDTDGYTALFRAVLYGNSKVVLPNWLKKSMSLKKFADKEEVANLLIGYGADINMADNSEWTPLHNVVFNGS